MPRNCSPTPRTSCRSRARRRRCCRPCSRSSRDSSSPLRSRAPAASTPTTPRASARSRLPGSAGVFFAVDVGGSSVKSGLVVDGEVEHLTREPIVELLAARGHRPDVFANDLVAATVGEAGGGTLALLQIGTGIAARCAVDGDVPRSAGGQAGEVGHFRFRANGRACRCGNRGCAEAYGAWGGITGRYEEAGRTPASPAALLRQAASGAWARHVLDEALEAVGFAASALVAACDPGTLRVGGGVAAAWGETLLEAIRAALSDQVLPAVAAATVVEGAALGDAAGLVGLAALARR